MKFFNNKKGIILAGGNGSRLNPITVATSKQLLPIYNKPTIYYPLTTLMLGDIQNILIITTLKDQKNYKSLLGNGNNLGMRIDYAIQDQPNGVAEAFIIAEKFIGDDKVSLILGDNLFFGQEISNLLKKFNLKTGASIFAYPVNDPERYGVVEFDKNFKAKDIIEKPKKPKSKYAITGLYMFDNKVIEYSKKLKPSKRGELEITELHKIYLRNEELNVNILGRATGWFDTGTFDSLHEASALIKTLEKRQGLRIGYPEEVAWRNGWIDEEKLRTEAMKFSHNEYGQYLLSLIED